MNDGTFNIVKLVTALGLLMFALMPLIGDTLGGIGCVMFMVGVAMIFGDGSTKKKMIRMSLPRGDLDLLRQWYNAVEDLNPQYLEQRDKDLYARIVKTLKTPTTPPPEP